MGIEHFWGRRRKRTTGKTCVCPDAFCLAPKLVQILSHFHSPPRQPLMPRKQLRILMQEILELLTNEGHTIKTMITEILCNFVPAEDRILHEVLDNLWTKGTRHQEIISWLCSRAEELYASEVRSLTSSTRGLHVPATRFSLDDLEGISRHNHALLFKKEAPNLWQLLKRLLDPDPERRRREWSYRDDRQEAGMAADRAYDSEAQERYYKLKEIVRMSWFHQHSTRE